MLATRLRVKIKVKGTVVRIVLWCELAHGTRQFLIMSIILQIIRSDEGLTRETSAFQSLYGGQFTLSTVLINQIFNFLCVGYTSTQLVLRN